MLTEDDLQHFDRFVRAIASSVETHPSSHSYCSLEALTNGEVPIFCLIRAGVEGPTRKEIWDYGKSQLRRDIFASGNLSCKLEYMTECGRLPSDAGDLSFRVTVARPLGTFYPSGSVYGDWPGQLFEIAPADRHNSYFPPEPLVGRNLPPFFDAADAIRDWTGIPVNASDSRFGEILLFLPDFTARLRKLAFKAGRLTVNSDFDSSTPLDISVLASDGVSVFRKTNPLRRRQVFRIMESPTLLSAFISGANGSIVDRFAEDRLSTTHERVIFGGAHFSQSLMEIIQRGESDTVEFKPFVDLADKKKAAEIVKAIISFANTAGGTILLGVGDDAEIEGIDPHIPHERHKAAAFQPNYFKALRKLLQQKLNRIPVVQMSSEQIGDKTVFVIRVEEGSAKPYFNVQTNEIFIRRGASDVKPNPDKDLKLMFGSAEDLGSLEFRWHQ